MRFIRVFNFSHWKELNASYKTKLSCLAAHKTAIFWASENAKFTFLQLAFKLFQNISMWKVEDTQETQLFFLQILKNSKSRFKNAKTIGISQFIFDLKHFLSDSQLALHLLRFSQVNTHWHLSIFHKINFLEESIRFFTKSWL